VGGSRAVVDSGRAVADSNGAAGCSGYSEQQRESCGQRRAVTLGWEGGRWAKDDAQNACHGIKIGVASTVLRRQGKSKTMIHRETRSSCFRMET
jgi:hypothetical protein